MSADTGDYDDRRHSPTRHAIAVAADHLEPLTKHLRTIEGCVDRLSDGARYRVVERLKEFLAESEDVLRDLREFLDEPITKG